MRRLSKRARRKNGGRGGGRVFKRFREHVILKYTPAMRSRIWLKFILATVCVIPRSRVLIVYVGACYTRGAGSRRSCGEWGRWGRWRGGGVTNEGYVMDG